MTSITFGDAQGSIGPTSVNTAGSIVTVWFQADIVLSHDDLMSLDPVLGLTAVAVNGMTWQQINFDNLSKVGHVTFQVPASMIGQELWLGFAAQGGRLWWLLV